MSDLRDALSVAEPDSLPFRGRVVEVASKLLSLGFHTGDPITNYTVSYFQHLYRNIVSPGVRDTTI